MRTSLNMLLTAPPSSKKRCASAARSVRVGRLVRQLLIEARCSPPPWRRVRNALRTGRSAARSALPTGLIPREGAIQLDGRVLAFSLGLALPAALGSGWPRRSRPRRDLMNPLRDAGRAQRRFPPGRLSSALVVIGRSFAAAVDECRGCYDPSSSADGGNWASIRAAAVPAGPAFGEVTRRQLGTFLRDVRHGSARCPASWRQRPRLGCPFQRAAHEFDVPAPPDDTWRATFKQRRELLKTLGSAAAGPRVSAEDDLHSRRVAS